MDVDVVQRSGVMQEHVPSHDALSFLPNLDLLA